MAQVAEAAGSRRGIQERLIGGAAANLRSFSRLGSKTIKLKPFQEMDDVISRVQFVSRLWRYRDQCGRLKFRQEMADELK